MLNVGRNRMDLKETKLSDGRETGLFWEHPKLAMIVKIPRCQSELVFYDDKYDIPAYSYLS